MGEGEGVLTNPDLGLRKKKKSVRFATLFQKQIV